MDSEKLKEFLSTLPLIRKRRRKGARSPASSALVLGSVIWVTIVTKRTSKNSFVIFNFKLSIRDELEESKFWVNKVVVSIFILSFLNQHTVWLWFSNFKKLFFSVITKNKSILSKVHRISNNYFLKEFKKIFKILLFNLIGKSFMSFFFTTWLNFLETRIEIMDSLSIRSVQCKLQQLHIKVFFWFPNFWCCKFS